MIDIFLGCKETWYACFKDLRFYFSRNILSCPLDSVNLWKHIVNFGESIKNIQDIISETVINPICLVLSFMSALYVSY